MTHVVGTSSVSGTRPRLVRARHAVPGAERRPGAVFVRLPRVDGGRTPAPARKTTSREALPQRRHSVEYDLRRVRRELQPPVSHSVRNTVILIVILLAAASLTVWVTQGIQERQTPPGRSPAAEADSLLTDRDAITSDEPPYSSAEGLASWPQPWQADASAAPAIVTWPPVSSETQTIPAESLHASPDDPWGGRRQPLAREPVLPQHAADHEEGSEIAIAPANPPYDDSLPGMASPGRAALSRGLADPASIDGGGGERYEGPVVTLLPIKPVAPVRR